MSFIATMNSGMSGLRAAQAGLAVASQNIANANTPGYVRAEVNLAPQAVAGRGGGVIVESVTRAADRFLAATVHTASAAASAAQAGAALMDQMQALFGDPNSETSMFGLVDASYAALASSAADPASPVGRRAAVEAISTVFDEFKRIGEGLEALRLEADQRVADTVGRMDELLASIHTLNLDVAVARGTGGDSTGAENVRGSMVDDLASLIDIRVTEKPDGKLEIRTHSGLLLVGVDRVQVRYEPSSGGFSTTGTISAVAVSGEDYTLDAHIRNGALAGLIEARDTLIPGVAEGLGVLADTFADELNRLHSVQASVPPPRIVEGRPTALVGSDAHHFSGEAVIALVSDRGEMQARLTLNFDTGETRLRTTPTPPDSVQTMGTTVDDVVAAINAQLGGVGVTASFSDGVFRFDAPAGSGVVFGEVKGNESERAGRGFAHFFGLNELARRDMPAQHETGFRDSDAHGLAAGGALVVRAKDAAGRIVAERTVTVTGATWGDMRAAINGAGGMAPYGGVQLDANGRMNLAAAPGYSVSIISDSTARTGVGVSMSTIFGLAPGAMARRAMDIQVNPEVSGDPRRLAVASPDLSNDVGTRVIEAGDGRGASLLAEVRNRQATFPQAGEIGPHRATLGSFTTRLGAEAGRLSVLAERQSQGADAIKKVAVERRASVEGVSIDDEVIRMNAYQQAYAAAARVIQAANEMWETLLAIR